MSQGEGCGRARHWTYGLAGGGGRAGGNQGRGCARRWVVMSGDESCEREGGEA